ncbi:hypothetical protein [Streptomyces sp. NPDC006012]|uniref:hypothetical protein n=1 Tax=Streptomyces sp. NPDC006012 TaxID=3364739 RepID=UPI0036C308DD
MQRQIEQAWNFQRQAMAQEPAANLAQDPVNWYGLESQGQQPARTAAEQVQWQLQQAQNFQMQAPAQSPAYSQTDYLAAQAEFWAEEPGQGSWQQAQQAPSQYPQTTSGFGMQSNSPGAYLNGGFYQSSVRGSVVSSVSPSGTRFPPSPMSRHSSAQWNAPQPAVRQRSHK